MVKSLCKNPELENLVCLGNKITRLDVSKNKKMKKLNVYNNSLKLLTIGGATALDEVECSRKKLTAKSGIIDADKGVKIIKK